jgi:flagellar protein FliS
MAAQAYQNYKQTQVEQADPLSLVAMLYDGALKHIRSAIEVLGAAGTAASGDGQLASEAMQARAAQQEQAHLGILKAYAIISELMATLDFQDGGAVAVQLEQLYEYALHNLREGDVRKDPAPLRQAERVIADLRQTWGEAFPQGLASVPPEQRELVGPERQRQRVTQEAQQAAQLAAQASADAATAGQDLNTAAAAATPEASAPAAAWSAAPLAETAVDAPAGGGLNLVG